MKDEPVSGRSFSTLGTLIERTPTLRLLRDNGAIIKEAAAVAAGYGARLMIVSAEWYEPAMQPKAGTEGGEA